MQNLVRSKTIGVTGNGGRGTAGPIFAKGQKLTHSPAHVEKHAGQETALHYTH